MDTLKEMLRNILRQSFIITNVIFALVFLFFSNTVFCTEENNNAQLVAPLSIPELLGWVPLSSCENICCGYYKDPLSTFANVPLPALETTAVEISAGETSLQQAGQSILTGGVTLKQPGRLLSANDAYLNRDPKTGAMSTDLKGGVTLREPGKLVLADSAHIELQSKAGELHNAIYHFKFDSPNPFANISLTCPVPPTTPDILSNSINAWGVAETVSRDPNGVIRLTHAMYSTCAPTANTWKLHASRIKLDPNTGRGTAYNTWMDVQGIPIFYTPYINFPINKSRKTGFLFPTVGHSSQSGYSIAEPFYWNIAPNYDATITPVEYSKRGPMLNGLFRYLTPTSSGNITGGVIFNDRAFATFQEQSLQNYSTSPYLNRLQDSSDTRRYLSWQNSTVFNPHWDASVNFNYVSDDYFVEDFDYLSPAVTNQLPQQAQINYHDDIWNFMGKVQAYQTLHPVNLALTNNPYQSLPELDLTGDFPNQAYGLDYKLNSQFVYFRRQQNPGELTQPPEAARFHLQPSVSLPITGLSGFFTPTLQLAATHYDINDQVPGYRSDVTRGLPIFDIDTGLYFDRDFSMFGGNYEQTLEPRLFYLYAPYVNQDNIPLFDTTLVPFSYDSLFLTNRFSSVDRIGDANQITLALTTRILDQNTGVEKFRASIGQIYYFRDRIVNANPAPGTPAAASTGSFVAIDPSLLVGTTSTISNSSPIAAQMVYHWTPALSATANGAWDPNNKQVINGGFLVQYEPVPNHVVNLSYNFVRYGDPQLLTPPIPPLSPQSHQNDLSLAGASFAWPIRDRWQVVGGLNYDVVHRYPQSYLYGVEYDSCCWAVRLVAARVFIGLNQNNNPTFDNTVYFQWQFKGLGNVGSADPASLLVGSIPGYKDTFDNFTFFNE